MKLTGNTILITGGGSGIGRGLAEAFHKAGNQVIIAGRRQQLLDETAAANPGMKGVAFDIEKPEGIRAFAAQIEKDFPQLNVLINNAGVMRPENLKEPAKAASDSEAIITTNLLGPIRLTTALFPLLKRQERSTIMMVSSGLAFVPLAITPTYCATKAAIHSYTMSLRWQLKGTNVEVVELIPPYVQTELMGKHQASDDRAMPLGDFLSEVMNIIKMQPDASEINVERVKGLRYAAENGKAEDTFKMLNEAMPAPH